MNDVISKRYEQRERDRDRDGNRNRHRDIERDKAKRDERLDFIDLTQEQEIERRERINRMHKRKQFVEMHFICVVCLCVCICVCMCVSFGG